MKFKVKKRCIKIVLICIMLIFSAVIVYRYFGTTTYNSGSATFCDNTEWLEKGISTSDEIHEKDYGPSVLVKDNSAYVCLKLVFYDMESKKRITNKDILRKILSMFEYTDEPFVFDDERSRDGYCVFYYDGIAETNKWLSIFKGFSGDGEMLVDNGYQFNNFYMLASAHSVSTEFFENIEDALDEIC